MMLKKPILGLFQLATARSKFAPYSIIQTLKCLNNVRHVRVALSRLFFNSLLTAMLREKMSAFFRALRQLSGDDAYERYLAHHSQTHPTETPLGRSEFFRHEQERKWNGVRRCC